VTAYPADKAKHARELAAAFNVVFVEMNIVPENASAKVGDIGGYVGAVKCGKIVDDTTYAVALHEIGHCVAACGGLPVERRDASSESATLRVKLIEERAAWEWAEYYACDWTPAMEQVKQWALSTYETGYAQTLQHDANRVAAEKRTQMKVNMDTASFAKRMGEGE